MSKKIGLNFSSPILYIVLGALLVIFRSQMLNWAMTIAGIFFVVMGVLDINKKKNSSGVINLVIGIAILVLGWTMLQIVLLVLGVLLAIKGVMELLDVLKRRNKNALQLVSPILTIVIGIALAFGDALGDLIAIIGVLLIADGLLSLLGSKK